MVNYPEIRTIIKLGNISNNFEKDRNALRKKALKIFVKEKAGKGKKELASNYKYIVEELEEGNYVYLTRPVPLNKGFDFVIHVSDKIFQNGKDYPKHDDVFNDLRNKKEKDEVNFKKLFELIKRVHRCEEPDYILRNVEISHSIGFHNDMILKTIKWFFIEQDIRYWNWSGRDMFMSGIKEIAESLLN